MGRELALMLLLIGLIAAYIGVQKIEADRAEARASAAEAQARRLEGELAAAQLKERVVTVYVDRIKVVRERAATITKEIPVYVTANADARCTVPAGFVWLHDAAAQNLPLGEPAGDPDAPAAGVTLAGVAGTVGTNYGICHEIRETLIGLQGYVDGLQALPRP